MKVYNNVPLHDFEFWCGGYETAKYLRKAEFDLIEEYLMEIYPDGMHETEVNAFFWFETDWIAKFLGFKSFEQIIKERRKPF